MKRARKPENIAALRKELETPPIPASLHRIWTTYLRMRRRAGSSGFGPAPLGYQDIEAFCRLTGTRLDAWEVGLLEMLDDCYLAPDEAK